MTPASCDSAARQAAAFNARGYRKIKMVAASSSARRSFIQTFMFWAFRLATYFVLACATYIFLDIAIKGSRVVFTNHAPFINVKFLTEPPQTLYVFEYQGRKHTRNRLKPPASRIRQVEFGRTSLARRCSSSVRWLWRWSSESVPRFI